MSIQLTFAVPAGDIFCPLAARAGAHKIITAASEKECAVLLKNHRVDAALISPLNYGLAATEVDYRIVPATGIFLEGYTNVASIWFAPGLSQIRRFVSSAPDNFIVTAGRILLAERYGLRPECVYATPDELLSKFLQEGCAIGYSGDIAGEPSLDITEDWYDSFEGSLPVGVWVCRQDDDIPAELPDIIRGLAAEDMAYELPVAEHICGTPTHEREQHRSGIIRRQWNSSSVEDFESVLNLLYYHQFLTVIPEAKFRED
ncbi:hypothetical protein MASR2M18_20690 [Ignavibacteria bacterium]|nr:hypothetical protein [Bacteroidota bacterium]